MGRSSELKINPEYEKLLPKLPAKEYEALKESIKTEGQHFPIIVNENNVILDGHHRYRICHELEITPKIEVKTFPNKLLEKKFVIEANLRRRHLNDFQKAELAYPLLAIERELAKQRKAQARGQPRGVKVLSGIDKLLIFKHPELPKIIHVSIDEKVRTQSWSDILAEVWSKKERKIPGWAWTSKADYIVYAFFNPASRKLMEPPRFIQPLELIKLLKTREYPTKLALNVGWTTVNKAIPKNELSSKPPKGWSIQDFVRLTEEDKQNGS